MARTYHHRDQHRVPRVPGRNKVARVAARDRLVHEDWDNLPSWEPTAINRRPRS